MANYAIIACPFCKLDHLASSYIIQGPLRLECPSCHNVFDRELAPVKELATPDEKSDMN